MRIPTTIVYRVSLLVKVVAGQAHALALTAEGELYFWGNNTAGQLGHGIITEKEINPIKVTHYLSV